MCTHSCLHMAGKMLSEEGMEESPKKKKIKQMLLLNALPSVPLALKYKIALWTSPSHYFFFFFSFYASPCHLSLIPSPLSLRNQISV